MSPISQLIKAEKIPYLVKIRQKFQQDYLTDQEIIQKIRTDIDRQALLEKVEPCQTIGITAGSRGIANIVLVTKTLVEAVKEKGAVPVIIPAMGSHGGATAQGQEAILAGYGITEETMGCPIHSSMDTLQIGTIEGIPVYFDSFAAACQGIIVVNRIKAHTNFRGSYESGLMKMLAVGLGKQRGAALCHTEGFAAMARRLPLIGGEILRKAPILMGVALLENAYERTCQIEILPACEIEEREPLLLQAAKARMGRIYFDSCDILVVRQIGKNFSGDGMDPNVVGRFSSQFVEGGLEAKRVGILDLSEETYGSAVGMGKADIVCRRLYEKLDMAATYANFLTTGNPFDYKIPIILDNDLSVFQALIGSCWNIDRENPEFILIKNSLEIEEILVSPALLAKCPYPDQIEILSEPFPLEFDSEGNLVTVF